jgi:hypothetical protein
MFGGQKLVSGVVLDSCIDWGHWGLGPRVLRGALHARVGADLWASTKVDNIVLLSVGTTVIWYGVSSSGTSQLLDHLDGTLFPVLLGR